MTDRRVLVVGTGPAGLSAAAALARAGLNVIVVDQAPEVGGAVYAQNRTGFGRKSAHAKERRALFDAVAALQDRIGIRCSTAFLGLDYLGNALIAGSRGRLFRPRAVIVATGARELVRPRPGWTAPCVTTAGALQLDLKTTGRPPEGRVAIAGSGPLLYTLGAQLARSGNAPVAIVEAARPFAHPALSLQLPLPILREAIGYVLTLIRARVPILPATRLLAIEESGSELRLTTSHSGRFGAFNVDRLGLHDGFAPNDYGLPKCHVIPVVSAGDCRAVLGRFAAVRDGARAAAEVLRRLGMPPSGKPLHALTTEEATQRRLDRIFAHDELNDLTDLPDNTVLCRCENRTFGDLKALESANRTARMLRLNGRFGMGACQGRFCLDRVARLAPEQNGPSAIRGLRCPIKPVTVADILNAAECSGGDPSTQTEGTT